MNLNAGYPRTVLRVGLAVLAMFHLFGLTVAVVVKPESSHIDPRTPMWLLLYARSLAVVPVGLAGLFGLLRFAQGRRAMVYGTLGLLGLTLNAEAYAALQAGHGHNVFFSGAPLLGWLFGLAAATILQLENSPTAREPLAEAGALGALAACYVSSAISKLWLGGLGWANGETLRAIVLTQYGNSGDGFSAWAVSFLLRHPGLADGLIKGVLILEAGAFLMLLGRRLRIVWGAGLIGFHLGVWVFLRIFYVDAMYVDALFAFPWPALVHRWHMGTWTPPLPMPEPAPTLPNPSRSLLLILLTGSFVLVLSSLHIDTSWTGLQRTRSHHAGTAAWAREPTPLHDMKAWERTDWVASLSEIGDLRRDTELSPGLAITAIDLRAKALDLRISTEAGNVVLSIPRIGPAHAHDISVIDLGGEFAAETALAACDTLARRFGPVIIVDRLLEPACPAESSPASPWWQAPSPAP